MDCNWIPLLWKNTFQRIMYSELHHGDQWSLHFNYSQTEELSYEEQRRGWMLYEHWAYGSFCCSFCSREWDSVNVAVLFRYRRRGVSRRGTAIATPCGQECHGCGAFVLPGSFEREVEDALEELSADIRNNCYTEEVSETCLMKTFDAMVAGPGYAWAQDRVRYVVSNLAVTDWMKQWIERHTVRQSQNLLWFAFRKNRITSSNFGEVLAAVRRRSYPPSLFRKLRGEDDLSRVEAVQYGRRNEDRAKQQYMRRTGMQIQERGVFLSDSGLLGASPDGTVSGGDRIVEVKCPHSAREMTVRQAAAQLRGFYLQLDDDGVLTLKPNHNYWHQIQGAMHLSRASSCDLVIWTPFDLEILEVRKDPSWAANIGCLETFYEYVFLPHVLSQM